MVVDDLVESNGYDKKTALNLVNGNVDVVKEGYRSATDEDYFISTHRKGDDESLAYFRNGNYIKSSVSRTSMNLDLLA